jgi:hypothetical protein
VALTGAASIKKLTREGETMSSDPNDNTKAPTIITADYAILGSMITELSVNGALELGDLARIHVPPGGGTVWQMPGVNGIELVDQLEEIILRWRDTRALWCQVPEEDAPGHRLTVRWP